MSTVSIIPLLFFAFHQNNDWAVLPSKILETELLLTPNIFVIQPDGYVNQSILNKPPYDYDNSSFYAFLDAEGFTTYDNFRSNYFSTLTSNASMFAMKHHYYSNTYKKGHKTFNANQVIVGHDNNTLNLLKHNNYSTHLLTDNSYFTIDRVPMIYDYHNVSIEDISFIKSGKIKTDMVSDLNQVLDTLNSTKNFFFIEKILPSHIARTNAQSKGIKGERDAYIMKLKRTNIWLKEVLKRIKQFDDDALVIIVADHGGFVGLHHTLESVKKPMNHVEVMSVFSSMLSIKWPKQLQGKDYDFRSNVNLFRTVFFALSDNQALLETNQDDTSHIPYYENASATYYECIDKNGNVILYGKRN